jgi:NTE family protein
LVLGAGGTVGRAFQAGALAALEDTVGWDARTAEVIVGTSAGSITGSVLRLGVSASDLAALDTGAPLSLEGGVLLDRLIGRWPGMPSARLSSWLRPWRPPTAALIARVVRRPWAFRPSVAAMTLLPPGTVDISERAAPLHALVGDDWPEGLWVCAARRSDGGRVVFGRPQAPPAALARAVLASCAIPGYFRPVAIGGVEYFDGGVHSANNAAVLRSVPLDMVVVISPMSAAGTARGADAPLRWSAHTRLQREARRLQARGTTVILIEPGPASQAAMGLRPLAEDRSHRIVPAAYEETEAIVRRIPVIRRLAG